MGLALVAEQEEPRRLFTPEQPPEPKPPRPQPTSPQVMAMFQAISTILAIRAALMLGGAGAFILFVIAALMPSLGSWGAATAYAVLVMIPLALLSARKG